MTRIRLLGVALVAVFAAAAVLSASAFALPEFLPSTGNNATFKGKSTSTPVLETKAGTKVECKKATGSGGFTSDTLGTFHISFEECKTPSFFNAACKSKSDAAGEILTLGAFHSVYDVLGTGESLGVAIFFEPNETEFECTGIAVSKVKGTLVCLVVKALTSSLSHEFQCNPGAAKGEQAVKKYYNDGGTFVNTQLLSSLNGGTFEESNEQAHATIETKEAGAYMNE